MANKADVTIEPTLPPVEKSPAVQAAPEVSEETLTAAMSESVKLAGSMLDVKTDAILAVGESIDNVLKLAKGRPGTWTSKRFGEVASDWNDLYQKNNPDSCTQPDAVRWWSVYAAVNACKTLGIADPERVAVKRYMVMFTPAFDFDRVAIVANARQGWADWLKSAIPVSRTGPDSISFTQFKADIDKQHKALHAHDPNKYKLPIHLIAKPEAKADPSKPANVTPAAAPSPSPAPSSAGKVASADTTPKPVSSPEAPVKPVVPPAGQKPVEIPANPVVVVSMAISNADKAERSILAVAIGKALLDSKDDTALLALYKTISKRVKAIREHSPAAMASVG